MSYSTVFTRNPDECNLNCSRIRKSCQQGAFVSSVKCGGGGWGGVGWEEVEEDRKIKLKWHYKGKRSVPGL